MNIKELRTDGLKDPLGIENSKPYFSWKLDSEGFGKFQTGYEIIVADSLEKISGCEGNIWHVKKDGSDQNFWVEYDGESIKSCTRYYWKVRCRDEAGNLSPWSETAYFETAYFSQEEWKADWIGYEGVYTPLDNTPLVIDGRKERRLPEKEDAAPRLRKEFFLKDKPVRAILSISGLGICYSYINGKETSDSLIEPAHTGYSATVPYRVIDVADLLKKGQNAIAAELGRGFYNIYENSPWEWHHCDYRSNPKLRVQLEIKYPDGSGETILSDESWKMTMDGPVTYNCIYCGENYDARKEMPGWTDTGFDDSAWDRARNVNDFAPTGKMTSMLLPPVRVTDRFNAVRCYKNRAGNYVFDVGKQIAGRVVLTAKAPEGTRIKIACGEKLDSDENVVYWNVSDESGLPQMDYYIFKGGEEESFAPKYNYKGFRYVVVSGMPEGEEYALTEKNVIAERFYNDVELTGHFQCSNGILNKINRNMVSTMLNNFHGKPTDCPTYEKNGWLGDANVIIEDALLNMDCREFFKKYCNDILDTLNEDGGVSQIAPTGKDWGYIYGAEWQTAAILIPWYIYLYTGDIGLLKNNYDRVKKVMEADVRRLKDNLSSSNMGDWVAPGCNKRRSDANAPEGPDITCNVFASEAFLAFSKISGILGRKEEEEYYFKQSELTKNAMNENFLSVNEDEYLTRWVSNNKKDYTGTYELNDGSFAVMGYRQTSNVAPIVWKKTPNEEIARKVVDRLAKEIESNPQGPHLDTGFVGTKFILPALTEYGYGELAYKIAVQTTYPSWGYLIANGADSMYEGWELSSRSFNHYFLGTGDEWLFKYLGGIQPNKPGFKEFTVKPYILGDLTYANCEIDTPMGKIYSGWKREERSIKFNISVPVNSKAEVHIPFYDQDGNIEYRICTLLSGKYLFENGEKK